ncbi:MAG: sulfotransferase, partial [Minisyncoccales bacterium]
MEKEIKWLIVQGCPRSGTTILTRLLNSHPLIYLTYEYNLAKPFFKNYYKIIPKKKLNRIIYLGDKLPQYFF